MQLHYDLYCDAYLLNIVDIPAHSVRKDVLAAAEDRLKIYRGRTVLGIPILNPYNIFTCIAAPVFTSVAVKSSYTQSMTDLAIVACALERHRLANGRFPASRLANSFPPS